MCYGPAQSITIITEWSQKTVCGLTLNTGSHLETSCEPAVCWSCFCPGKQYQLCSMKSNCRVHEWRTSGVNMVGYTQGQQPHNFSTFPFPSPFPELEPEKKGTGMDTREEKWIQCWLQLLADFPRRAPHKSSEPSACSLWVSPSSLSRVSAIKNTYLVDRRHSAHTKLN